MEKVVGVHQFIFITSLIYASAIEIRRTTLMNHLLLPKPRRNSPEFHEWLIASGKVKMLMEANFSSHRFSWRWNFMQLELRKIYWIVATEKQGLCKAPFSREKFSAEQFWFYCSTFICTTLLSTINRLQRHFEFWTQKLFRVRPNSSESTFINKISFHWTGSKSNGSEFRYLLRNWNPGLLT